MWYYIGWECVWCLLQFKKKYDVIIVGVGGYGLVMVYYFGKNFGIINVVIIEKGWFGGGNIGWNMMIIWFNYFQDLLVVIYDKVLSLYENLLQDLNYNVMFSLCGLIMLV